MKRFNYGNQDLSGNPGMNDGLTQAWLDSSLQISPLEQVAFLHRLVTRQLGVSPRAYDMTARLTAVGTLPGGWAVHGKTGTGYRMNGERGGPDLHRQIGWFVGWASRDARTIVFACVITRRAPGEHARRAARQGAVDDPVAAAARDPAGDALGLGTGNGERAAGTGAMSACVPARRNLGLAARVKPTAALAQARE